VPLSSQERSRHARQILVPGMLEGQERLAASRIRVVGAGGAAGAALVALVRAGAGRVWIDDPEDAGEADRGGWLLSSTAAGSPRAVAAAAQLSGLPGRVRVEPYPTGGVPTATRVCAPTVAEALIAAEQARRAGVPHVVLEIDGEAGSLVTIPPGAPCYACARPTATAWRPAEAGAAAIACLAVIELLLAIAFPGEAAGRRIDLVRGLPISRPTVRLAGCACGSGPRP
jgi:molybdopterin/thiamine biosynthesis adenylyltransferase